jgi:hypothetical protein
MYEQDAPVGSRGVAVPVRRGRVGGLIGSAARRPDWQQKLSVVVHRARDRMQMVYRTSLTNSINTKYYIISVEFSDMPNGVLRGAMCK